MKKLMTISIVTLSVGLVLVLVASVLNACAGGINGFTVASLTTPLNSIGYLVAALSGVLLTGGAVISVVKGGDLKKLIQVSAIIVAVGLTFVITSGILVAVAASINTAAFNIGTATTGITGALNTIGYLGAVLAGVLLVASSVMYVIKDESNKDKAKK